MKKDSFEYKSADDLETVESPTLITERDPLALTDDDSSPEKNTSSISEHSRKSSKLDGLEKIN